jgi:hypothetical protein
LCHIPSWPGLSRPSRFTWRGRAFIIGIAGSSPAMTAEFPLPSRPRRRAHLSVSAPHPCGEREPDGDTGFRGGLTCAVGAAGRTLKKSRWLLLSKRTPALCFLLAEPAIRQLSVARRLDLNSPLDASDHRRFGSKTCKFRQYGDASQKYADGRIS